MSAWRFSSNWSTCVLSWIFLYLSGACGHITVHQSPVVVTKRAQDVILQCLFTHSPDENVSKTPILYWDHLNSDKPVTWPRLWPITEKYKGRVDLLDNDKSSTNKSILLRNVQWGDAGKHQCKLSYTKGEQNERKRGAGTLLMVYDSIVFNTTAENEDQLMCAINVSRAPGFVLVALHNGLNVTLGTTQSSIVPAMPHYVLLSGMVPLRNRGAYECQLYLNSTLIVKKIFHQNPAEPEEKVYPEPWLLYAALLLVHCAALLVLLTALLLVHRRQ